MSTLTPTPQACNRYTWCDRQQDQHTEHRSQVVPVPTADADIIVYAVTDPDTGAVTYGPVIGAGDGDAPVGRGRVLAAQLRTAAARVEELVAWAESS